MKESNYFLMCWWFNHESCHSRGSDWSLVLGRKKNCATKLSKNLFL